MKSQKKKKKDNKTQAPKRDSNENDDQLMTDGGEKLEGKELAVQMFYIGLLPTIIKTWMEHDGIIDNEFLKVSDVHFRNGNIYKGATKRGVFEGHGVFKWSDGSRYTGNFTKNHPSGYGVYISRDNVKYRGEFSLGVCHGNGEVNGKNFSYIGEFKNGKLSGIGLLKCSSRYTFDGVFENDNLHYGFRYYDYGVYGGSFNEESGRKYGKLIFRNNDSYTGNWCNDLFYNFGRYKWFVPGTLHTNNLITYRQTMFTGFWVHGARNGFGVLEFDETIIMTIWNENIKHGPGIIRARNGEFFASKEMFFNDEYKEGYKIKITNKTLPIFQTLIDWMENADQAGNLNINDICGVSKDSKVFHTNASKFEIIVNLLLKSIDKKCDIYPLFIPNYALEKYLPCIDFVNSLYRTEHDQYVLTKEIHALTQVIVENVPKLENIYYFYSALNNPDVGSSKELLSLTRLGLWLFYRDVFNNYPKIYAGEIILNTDEEYHLTPTNSNNAFEKVSFWKFIRHIINVVKILNERNPNILENSVAEYHSFFGLFATMFLIFLREFPLVQKAPPILTQKYPEIIYELYSKIKQINEKLTIRSGFRFFKSIKDDSETKDNPGYLSKCTTNDFLQASCKLFPKMLVDEYNMMKTNFMITGYELLEIIILCFEKDLYKLKVNRMQEHLLMDADKNSKKKSPGRRKQSGLRITSSTLVATV